MFVLSDDTVTSLLTLSPFHKVQVMVAVPSAFAIRLTDGLRMPGLSTVTLNVSTSSSNDTTLLLLVLHVKLTTELPQCETVAKKGIVSPSFKIYWCVSSETPSLYSITVTRRREMAPDAVLAVIIAVPAFNAVIFMPLIQ